MKQSKFTPVRIVSIVLLVLVALVLSAVLVIGMLTEIRFPAIFIKGQLDKEYQVLDQDRLEFSAEQIKELDIDWRSGQVEIKTHDQKEIVIEETGYQANRRLAYRLKKEKLSIRYDNKTWSFNIGINLDSGRKRLTVYVPVDYEFKELEIDSISAEVLVDKQQAKRLKVNSVSGDLKLFGDFEQVGIDTMSGDTQLTGKINRVTINGISGESTIGFLSRPQSLKVNTISGDVTVFVDREVGVRVEMESLSGKSNYAMSGYKQGDHFIVGDGQAEFEINTVSGNLSLDYID